MDDVKIQVDFSRSAAAPSYAPASVWSLEPRNGKVHSLGYLRVHVDQHSPSLTLGLRPVRSWTCGWEAFTAA